MNKEPHPGWFLLVPILLVVVLTLVGKLVVDAKKEQDTYQTALARCNQEIYGPNLFYFPCTGSNFGHALLKFQDDNPHKLILAITANGTGIQGLDLGYWIVTKNL